MPPEHFVSFCRSTGDGDMDMLLLSDTTHCLLESGLERVRVVAVDRAHREVEDEETAELLGLPFGYWIEGWAISPAFPPPFRAPIDTVTYDA
jgi:hypothetical protein